MPSETDTSLFIYNHHGDKVYILVYVDGILVASSSSNVTDHVLRQLQESFVVKNLGEVYYFLCIEVNKQSDGICFDRRNTSKTCYRRQAWKSVSL